MQFKESQFKVGDTVATINVDTMKIDEFVVQSVIVTATENGQAITLRGEDFRYYNEDKCFASREELLLHLEQ